MESNFSIFTTFLTMESLDIHPSNIIPAFIFGALTYSAILFFNITVLLTIAFNRKLHKPMYILLFNLPINDMMGATAFFPQLLFSILTQNRSISYTACFAEAFLIHMYGAGLNVTLVAMAYDRYIAICSPLKYNTLISANNMFKVIVMLWSLDLALIGLMLALNYRRQICSRTIVDMFCNNPSLMKLICEDTRANNYYGLFTLAFFQGVPLLIVIYTYIQILITVIYKRQSDAKSKVIQTCGTHLIVFLSFEINSLFALISHRFEAVSPNLRRAFGASVMIFPPIFNPLIYGLRMKEIRQNLIFLPKRKVSPTKHKNRR
ncbi:putative gustatory receptor [Astyanax mexicanus]|uniref:Olfactory receptor family 52 subfamily J member 3 n=1 Tax=Astyanax mexicanus TaxID=7994 RepID=A0A8B9KTT5_ASTMX|nr:putative gustatory receptor [Astyanax mexicanus]